MTWNMDKKEGTSLSKISNGEAGQLWAVAASVDSALYSVLRDNNLRIKLINLLKLFSEGDFCIDLSKSKNWKFINNGSNVCDKYLIISQKELNDFIFSRILRRYWTATKINKKELKKVITLEIPKELSLPDGVMENLSIE